MKDIGDGTIGKETPDCSVLPVKGKPDYATVSTVDFFYPTVQDPFKQGQIAVCNVLSDLYAMGITNIDNILMILGVCLTMSQKEQDIVTMEMIKGFTSKAKEAKVPITGGQSIKSPWPLLGGCAMATLKKRDIIFPNNFQIGHKLILTKPLGTQIASNIIQWYGLNNRNWIKSSKFITENKVMVINDINEKSMCRLNKTAAELMREFTIGGCTDVTGFGLKGHAQNLLNAQEARSSLMNIVINTMPIIPYTNIINDNITDFGLRKGTTAETSGGLLIAIDPKHSNEFIKRMNKANNWAWEIGSVTKGTGQVIIDPNSQIIPVLH